MNDEISPFKSYLTSGEQYLGGKSLPELSLTGGQQFYKLNSNENPYGPSPKVRSVLIEAMSDLSRYPDQTDRRLCLALAKFYHNRLVPEQFLTENSGVALLELIMRGFLGPGLECIHCSPCFAPYRLFPSRFGAKAVDVPLIDHERVDFDGILAAINVQTRLILLASPNNPTGSIIPSSHMETFLTKVPAHVVIVFDEVYWHYVEKSLRVTAEDLLSLNQRVIGLNSFSKAFGLAALRIGYAYASQRVISYLINLSRPFTLNRLSMEAAIAALGDQQHLDMVVGQIRKERKWMLDALGDLGAKVKTFHANFFILETKAPGELELALQKKGILTRTLLPFGAPQHLRISLGRREANMAVVEALANLKHLWV